MTATTPAEAPGTNVPRSSALTTALSTSLDVLNEEQKKLIVDSWDQLTREEKIVVYDYVKDVKEGLELPTDDEPGQPPVHGTTTETEPQPEVPASDPAPTEPVPADTVPQDAAPGVEAPATEGTPAEQPGTVAGGPTE